MQAQAMCRPDLLPQVTRPAGETPVAPDARGHGRLSLSFPTFRRHSSILRFSSFSAMSRSNSYSSRLMRRASSSLSA